MQMLTILGREAFMGHKLKILLSISRQTSSAAKHLVMVDLLQSMLYRRLQWSM